MLIHISHRFFLPAFKTKFVNRLAMQDENIIRATTENTLLRVQWAQRHITM